MKILNLATTDQGGAGIASVYFNEMFNNTRHQSVLVVKQSNRKNHNVIVIKPAPSNILLKLIQKVQNRLRRLRKERDDGIFDEKYIFLNINENRKHITAQEIITRLPFKPDIIVLHWVTNFVNTETIKALQELTQAKLFWIMMDNAPITGGCHYPWECKSFEKDCSNCPAILDLKMQSIAQNNLNYKIHNLPNDIELIVCSESDYKRALRSAIFKTKKVHKILFPIDSKKFTPGSNKEAKKYFGIEPETIVIFNGSISLANKRKGSILFIEALALLQNKYENEGKEISNLLILVAGNNTFLNIEKLNIPFRRVPFLTEAELIKAYQAADVFVSASLEDSGPLMINQSIMCGTPVVSFDIGVALDLVISGQTGYLARLGDIENLAFGIKYILDLEGQDHKKMSENCRNFGLELCHPEKQTEKFMSIFQTQLV